MGELTHCLNCGRELRGPFCAGCGQRVVPPHPTVRELAGDAWNELTGYDGRIMATLRGLGRPGFLTREYIEGRRAHYLPPIRVYLVVSVLYFLIAASVPDLDGEQIGNVAGPGGLRIGITKNDGNRSVTEADRQEILAELETAPWYLKPMMQSVLEDPDAFRMRVFTIMPRVFFALVPVFAAIVHVFYRKHHFPAALVFAVHVHVFAFVAFSVSEAMKFTYSEIAAAIAGVIMLTAFVVYAVRSFRAVFGGSWPMTIVKAASIALVYAVASLPAFIVIFLWASLT